MIQSFAGLLKTKQRWDLPDLGPVELVLCDVSKYSESLDKKAVNPTAVQCTLGTLLL